MIAAASALIERWLHADRTHTLARLHAVQPPVNTAVPNLHALVRRELSVPGRYRLAAPATAQPSWWAAAWAWAAERWSAFWHAVFGRVHVGKETAATLGDVLLAIVALVLVVTAVRLLRNLHIARAARSGARSELLGDALSSRVLYDRACEAGSRGDYATAALLLFRATVLLLDRNGALAADDSATVGDVRRELRARNAALLAPFDDVAMPFVQTAYAERPPEEPQWRDARTAYILLASQYHPDIPPVSS